METEASTTLISGNGLIFIWLYLGSLLVIGLWGKFAQKENTLSDFYLSGRQLGFFVLFFTIYATQYSGNTLIGFSAESYRDGFDFLVSVGFMMGVVAIWLVYAPRLHRVSKKFNLITVGDYIQHRYRNRALTTFATILCLVALGNYILTNLKAVGTIMVDSTGGAIPIIPAIVGASLIMVIYETLGGMRSVAWTDTLQGVLLLFGCFGIFIAVYYLYGGLTGSAQILMENRQDLWTPPDTSQKLNWLSTLIMMSLGIALYPHAIQRIYASKDETTLRKSFQIMLFMPFVTTFIMLVVGVVGAAQFPGLDKDASEGITLLLLTDIVSKLPWFHMVAILFICAAIAAIMSTVDSALLTMSSMFAQDIYLPLRPKASQASLVVFGKVASWVVMALMTYLAIKSPATIWQLIVIKLEILCQVAPALILGLYFRKLHRTPVFLGMICGTILVVFLMFAQSHFHLNVPRMPWNVHAGIWGLILNLLVIGIFSPFYAKK